MDENPYDLELAVDVRAWRLRQCDFTGAPSVEQLVADIAAQVYRVCAAWAVHVRIYMAVT